MTRTCARLTAADFDAAMALLDRAFAEHGTSDFPTLLPALYRPTDTHMGRQLGIREGLRLVAMLGVFPIDWHVGEEVLRVAGIGGVAVDPEHRGRGLMRTLMEHARDEIAAAGFPLSFLSGQRQRYRWFGWEAAGSRLKLDLCPKNLAALPPRAPAVRLEPLDDTVLSDLEALHRSQPIHCLRPPSDFGRHLRNWRHEPLVARVGGDVVGYLVVKPDNRMVFELVARATDSQSPDQAVELLRAYAASHSACCELVLPAVPSPLVSRLATDAERIVVESQGNWWVRDFARVAGALLAMRHAAAPLSQGAVVLRSEDQTFRLFVDASGAGASPCSSPPSLTLDGATMTRLLFGPLPPAAVTALPAAAAPLQAWCPLPLALPVQDQV